MKLGIMRWREADELPKGFIGFKTYPVAEVVDWMQGSGAVVSRRSFTISYHSSLGFFIAVRFVIPWRA